MGTDGIGIKLWRIGALVTARSHRDHLSTSLHGRDASLTFDQTAKVNSGTRSSLVERCPLIRLSSDRHDRSSIIRYSQGQASFVLLRIEQVLTNTRSTLG